MKILGGRSLLEGYIPRHFQRLLILCIACSIFFLSFNAFGGIQNRSFTRPDNFPRKIWQSWKVDPLRFEARDNERARTWIQKNSAYRYEVLTDANALSYVEENFGPSGFNRPDIVYTYRLLSAKIIKADLLRYLIMYAEGGVYADIDVEAIRSIDHFIPNRFDESDIDLVIGIETDEPVFQNHPILGQKSQSFCQWTFMAKPRLPVMMMLIDNILKWLNDLSQKQKKPISNLDLDFDEVLSGTGPSAFTTAILAQMSSSTGESVTWETFHNMVESKVVGSVLVLTAEAFAAGTGHSDSGNHGGKSALIKHHFHASSWPTNHPRYKHPVYGEVEKCNWNVECVKLWDANTALFASLSEQEQLKMIAIKEIDEESTQGITFDLSEVTLGFDPPLGDLPPAALPPPAAGAGNEALPAEVRAPAGIPKGAPADDFHV